MRILYLFSSDLERDAAFPDGAPSDVITGVSGIGLVDASIGTARAIAATTPDAVVFLGTCGAHKGAGVGIGDIVAATALRLGSGDVARGDMRLPVLLVSEVACDESLTQRVIERSSIDVTRVLRCSVSCTIGVTESDELAAALYAHDGSGVENLEAFGVARAAGELPVAVLLAVTNVVGPGGGTAWRENYRRAMHHLAHGFCNVSNAGVANAGEH